LAGGGKRHRAAVWKNDTSSEAGDDERRDGGGLGWGVLARHLTLLLQIKQVRSKTPER